jgi:hypothetical protein
MDVETIDNAQSISCNHALPFGIIKSYRKNSLS